MRQVSDRLKEALALRDITGAELGLPGSPYSLRHTFVSIVASQTQIPEGTIRELVGHSDSMDTFGTYKHTVDGELESAASIINLTFERLKTAEQ